MSLDAVMEEKNPQTLHLVLLWLMRVDES